jgi:hypothetical protein
MEDTIHEPASPDAEAIFAQQQAEAFDKLKALISKAHVANQSLQLVRNELARLEEEATAAEDAAEEFAGTLVAAGLITEDTEFKTAHGCVQVAPHYGGSASIYHIQEV